MFSLIFADYPGKYFSQTHPSPVIALNQVLMSLAWVMPQVIMPQTDTSRQFGGGDHILVATYGETTRLLALQ
jgi:hypothetical protein